MTAKVRKRGEEIRKFILANVEHHPRDIAALVAEEFGITRDAVNKHLQMLVQQNAITAEGTGRNKIYRVCSTLKWERKYPLVDNLQEDVVWDSDIKPLLTDLPDNVRRIWFYGFCKMFNDALDHSSGEEIAVTVLRSATDTFILIRDNGEGIFRKIKRAFSLLDERHAVIQLAKGKLTTDPDRHSGEGIFFRSRMFDDFVIISGDVFFSHEFSKLEDWIISTQTSVPGTAVAMRLDNNTARTAKQVFDSYVSGDDYTFSKTVVPVQLAQYGDDLLVSRSQAKRLLAGIDWFKIVIFDFRGVETISQAFADEVFRVFSKQHPEIELVSINENTEVAKMISRAKSTVI